jgi:hypothetical protein
VGGSGPSTEGQRSRGLPEGKTPHFSDLCVEPWGIGEGGRRSNGQSESQASQEAHQVGLQEQEVRAHGAAQQRGRAASLYGKWCCARPLLLDSAFPACVMSTRISLFPVTALAHHQCISGQRLPLMPLPWPGCHRCSSPCRQSSGYHARYTGWPRSPAGASPGPETLSGNWCRRPPQNPDHPHRKNTLY